jgi:hypothetical protein
MSDHPKLAPIECAECSPLIEVYPGSERGGPNLEWITPDEDLYKEPPLARCRHARTDVARRIPGSLD